jgi:hypothetical protein
LDSASSAAIHFNLRAIAQRDPANEDMQRIDASLLMRDSQA